MHPTLTKTFEATTAIGPNLFVAAHADRRKARLATAAADPIFGISDLGADLGGQCDVHLTGAVPVKAGGAIAAGAPVTSDANGRAVTAVAGVGAIRVAGFALEPAVDGDLFMLHLAPSILPAA